MDNTLVLVKPDGVKKGLVGEILRRFEQRGLQIVALKMVWLSEEMAQVHYEEHKGKVFFADLINFITSGPIVAVVIRGEKAIKTVRTMMGSTNPVDAAPGTIRGDFALSMSQNIVHGSDSELSAIREINIYFHEDEIQN